MKSFQDMLDDDIDDVFFNLDEFAENVDFNGCMLKAVKSNIGLDGYKTSELTATQGVAKRYQRISLKSKDMPENVFVSGTVYINDEQWFVDDIADNKGITTLVLSYLGGR